MRCPIDTARHASSKDARRLASVAPLLILMFLASPLVCLGAVSGAQAGDRFGDSTWVAPGPSFNAAYVTDGPRVARPDQERTWETILRTPFRVAFFPLRLVARGLEAGAAYVGPRFLEPKVKGPPKSGPVLSPYVTFGGVDDIGVGPAITWVGLPSASSRLRLEGSWSSIDQRRVRFSEVIGFERPVGFALRADYDYKPNRRYYGIGNNTPESDLSYYRLETAGAEAALLLGTSPLRQVRLGGGYSSMSPSRGYNGTPLLQDVFAAGDTPFEHRATRELWYGVAADLAILDDARHPSRGLHGQVDLRRAAGVRASDPDFDQWRAEGRVYLPVFAKRRVIAFRAVFAGIEPRGNATVSLPFYRLTRSVRGSNFAGYTSDRFRDRQLLLARVEYRWAILRQLSALALYELGEVAPSLGAFRLRDAHRSIGGGLRLGLSDETALRIEVAKSVEGLHAMLALGSGF